MNRRSTAFFRSLFGKGEYKSCAFGIVCVETDVAAEYSGEEAGDGESESGSLCLFVEFHEALEDRTLFKFIIYLFEKSKLLR